MAKLLAPYSLCPLIEQRRLFGVNEDSHSGCVIVTLGKNIVIRYRLSDQKQVSSWSSKNKLSAPVIYDHVNKQYIGVFNYDEIAFWHDSLAQLNKIRKFRFSWLIHSILSTKDCPAVIVYCNGHVGMLSNDFKNRKNLNKQESTYLEEKESVKTSKLVSLNGEYYVSIQSRCKETGKEKLHFVPIDPDRGTRFVVPLEKENVTLSAFAVIDGESPQFLTLWSDGALCSEDLPPKSESHRPVANVTCINTNLPSALLPIEDDHVVLYGAAPNSEGAHLVILSLKFGLPEATQRMKVYDKQCCMWSCKNDIIVVCGGHLVVTPYRLGTTRLVSLLGVGKQNDKNPKMDTDQTLKEKIDHLKKEGNTDNMICDQILPDLISNKQNQEMLELIDLLVDIPDRWIVEMIVVAVDSDENLLNKLLSVPLVGDESSLNLIRKRIKLESVLKLIKIISHKINEGQGNKCLLDWASLLLDSHYHQYILSKDSDVIDAIRSAQESVQDYLECINVINDVKAEINSLKKGRIDTTKLTIASHGYLYEKIRLY